MKVFDAARKKAAISASVNKYMKKMDRVTMLLNPNIEEEHMVYEKLKSQENMKRYVMRLVLDDIRKS